jgi:uncharacterized membrane protein
VKGNTEPVSFMEIVETTGKALDGVGVAAILGGFVWTLFHAFRRHGGGRFAEYRSVRRGLGRSILLGLEILVAADIIRTVAIEPTLESVAVLGGIVLIRTFLSFSLEVELNGAFPWMRERGSDTGA